MVLELKYVLTEQGQKIPTKYKVEIVSRPSNLGSGKIYYFVCPSSRKLCRTLYMGYRSAYFKSKEAYNYRIYYASQLSSRINQYNDRYWSIERKLEAMDKKHPKTHYQGEQTKAQKRIKTLKRKNEYNDEKRWEMLCTRIMPNFR